MKTNPLKHDVLMLVLSAVISAVVSFGMWMWQETINVRTHNEYLVKQIRTTVLNDIRTTIPVAEGIGKSLLNKQVIGAAFKMIYYPTVDLTMDNIGMLPNNILSDVDDYKRSLDQCVRFHENYIESLRDSADDKRLVGWLIAYYVSLDSLIRRGIDIVRDIDGSYPNLSNKAKPPAYISLSDFKGKVISISKLFSLAIPTFD